MFPLLITLDTGSGYKLIREGKLPTDWQKLTAMRPSDLSLADANGNPLTITSVVRLCFRLGNTSFHVWFQVCPTLSVDVIIGTEFANKNVKAIWCMDQRVTLQDNTEVPILSSHPGFNRTDAAATMVVTSLKDKPETLRLTKAIEHPRLTQAYVKVITNPSGLVSVEPKRKAHSRKGVRLANGIVEVQPRKKLS